MQPFTLLVIFLFSVTRIFGQATELPLKITHVTGDFYVYSTYNTYEGNKIAANGMYLVTKDGVLMFDTPWDTTQFQPLLDSIQAKHNKKVLMCFATHWHSDKTAGLEYYRQQGIKTYTTVFTDELSKKNDKKRAEILMSGDTSFYIQPYRFETYYPGPGHSLDNIVIWFPQEKILYAGCLVKAADAQDLGYLGDADVKRYEGSLKKLEAKFPSPSHIIISHGDWKNKHSLKNSIKLAGKIKKED